MTWFDIIKNKQTKLPKELTEGAVVSQIDAKDWFNKKKFKPKEEEPQEDNTTQTTLEVEE